MKLSDEQAIFAQNVIKLIEYIFSKGYKCTFGEAYRPPEMAAIYKQEGKGIANSLHTQRLAIDLNIFAPDGTLLHDAQSYAPFGAYWKTLNPNNCYGGDFVHLVDADHFSMKSEYFPGVE